MRWLLHTSSGRGQTYSERLASILELVERYHAKGIARAASVLPGRARVGVAHAARHAVFGCPCSQGIDDGLALNDYHHEVCPELVQAFVTMDGVKADEAAKAVTDLIHPMTNCQHRLDKDWYLGIMDLLDKTGLIPQEHEGEKRQYFLHTLYCEIVLVATMVHSMYTFCLTVGVDPPELPGMPNSQNDQPYWFDWTKAVKPSNNGLSHGGVFALIYGESWAPFLPRFSVDPESPEFNKIRNPPRPLRTWFNWMGIVPAPFSGVTYSVVDFLWLHEWIDMAYASPAKHFFFPWKPLGGDHYCSNSFTRYDQEVVATAVAIGHKCAL